MYKNKEKENIYINIQYAEKLTPSNPINLKMDLILGFNVTRDSSDTI